MEAEVLKEYNGAIVRLGDDILDLGTNAVGSKGDRLAEKLLELRDDGLEGVLFVDGTVGTAEVGHEDDGLGAIVEGALDGRDGADDALGVRDIFVLVEGNVEVDLGMFSKRIKQDKKGLPIEATRGKRKESKIQKRPKTSDASSK